MHPWKDDHLREALRQGFENRPTLRLAEAAKLLKLHRKTLLKLVEQGTVPCRITGAGRRRLRREFSLTDIERFYANAAARPACTRGARPIARVRTHPRVRGSFLADRAAAMAGRQDRWRRRKAKGRLRKTATGLRRPKQRRDA